MIQIIERGTRKITECKTCGCKFSYEQNDVVNEDLDNYKAFREYVPCPQCGTKVVIRQSR